MLLHIVCARKLLLAAGESALYCFFNGVNLAMAGGVARSGKRLFSAMAVTETAGIALCWAIRSENSRLIFSRICTARVWAYRALADRAISDFVLSCRGGGMVTMVASGTQRGVAIRVAQLRVIRI